MDNQKEEELKLEISNNAENILNSENFIEDLTSNKLPLFFSNNEIKANVSISRNEKSIKVGFFESYSLSRFSTCSFDFTFHLVNDEIDMVSHFSLFDNNANRNPDSFNQFTILLSKINSILLNLDNGKLIQFLIDIKNNINTATKLKDKNKILEEELKSYLARNEINKIYSVLVPVSDFCIDSYLCEVFNVPFKDNPTKQELNILKDKFIETYNKNIAVKEYDNIIHRKIFNILEVGSERSSYNEYTFYLQYDSKKNKFSYSLERYSNKMKSKKKINELLSYQIKFNNKTIEYKDVRRFGLSSYIQTKELIKNLQVEITQKSINIF